MLGRMTHGADCSQRLLPHGIGAQDIAAHDIAALVQLNHQLCDHNQQLHDEVQSLKHQLDWFKRQLFGQTSEKRLVQAPGQGNLLQGLAEPPADAAIPTERITYERKKLKKPRGESVTDSGLRFDENVPVQQIRVAAPELEGPEADQYIVIDEHITYRLAQQRSAYIVLGYLQPVIKHKASGVIITQSAPAPVLEKSIADVSFMVGMIIDKFLYHQPLHRQHQKLMINGITLSRTTLTNLVRRAIGLLEPVYEAQLRHILLSKVLALDEMPTKAGRKHQGKMRQAWYWPLLGEDHEIAFHYSPSRARAVIDELLKDFVKLCETKGSSLFINN
jgi:transposase